MPIPGQCNRGGGVRTPHWELCGCVTMEATSACKPQYQGQECPPPLHRLSADSFSVHLDDTLTECVKVMVTWYL